MITCNPFFQIPIITLDVSNWTVKKNKVSNIFKNYPEQKIGIQNFYTNKHLVDMELIEKFANIFNEEFTEITNFYKKDIKITSVWTVTYKTGDYQSVHNHSSTGFTGIMYLDHNKHTPKTMFVQPWNDMITDETVYGIPDSFDKKIIIVPSFVNHFSNPVTGNNKKRILSFDFKL
jgi:hypothetical protein